jgi:hypothetical protein
MNEMYNMSIVTHGTFVFWLLAMILVNYVVLLVSDDLNSYRRKKGIVYAPLDFVGLVGVIFTGVVMMASKHLDFTIENIIMIMVAIGFVFAEIKRSKEFKYVKNLDEFSVYKIYAKKILLIEFFSAFTLAVWMWI